MEGLTQLLKEQMKKIEEMDKKLDEILKQTKQGDSRAFETATLFGSIGHGGRKGSAKRGFGDSSRVPAFSFSAPPTTLFATPAPKDPIFGQTSKLTSNGIGTTNIQSSVMPLFGSAQPK